MHTFSFLSPLPRDTRYVTAPLRQGRAELRPRLRGEVGPQREVFDRLSPESRWARFLTPVTSLPAGHWRALAEVDGVDHVAWLATVEGRPAGVARYIRTGGCAAEIALEVADHQQGLGLGAVLLDTISTIAAASRLSRLQAYVASSNSRSRKLLAQIGLELRPNGDLLEADSSFHLLDPPRVDRPAVVRVAFELRNGALDAAGVATTARPA
jgi:GNAT superfamily N-acetyltransferase